MPDDRTDDEIFNDVPPLEEKEEETKEDEKKEDEETTEETQEEETTEDEVEEKETKEEEKEEKGEEKDEDEDKPVYGVLSYAQLKKYDPELLKKFPTLRRAIQSDAAIFSNFGSIEEFEEFAGRQENYQAFEKSIVDGDPSLILKALKAHNIEAFDKFTSNIIPVINELSQETFRDKIADPVISNFLATAIREGQRTKNENLILAARHLARATYGTSDGSIPEVTPLKREVKIDPEKVELQRKLQERENQDLGRFQDETWTSAKKTFENELIRIVDPKGELTPFTRSAIIREVEDKVGLELAQDQLYNNQMNQLWRAAIRNNFRPEVKTRVIQAFLARARPSARKIASEIIKEALPTSSRVKVDPSTRKAQIGGNAPKTQKVSNISPKQINYNETSDEDILNDRVVLRK